ncbi:MAG TPA: pseudouridine synthase [Flavisolibacter sp.]|nr:pseudouridine synthase [Flavisolibacter sp.]
MSHPPFRYFMLNKPFGMESQFISAYPGPLLGDLDFDFPEGTHAIGRLDKNSEGLLLLTTNKKITALLFHSKVPHKRNYLVQVRHEVSRESLEQLRTGVSIRIRGGYDYKTPSCDVQIVEPPHDLFPLPFESIDYYPTTWLLMTLTEGRYRQVRKMVAAVRHRCQRLIRISIEDMELGRLAPGKIREFGEEEFFTLLKLDKSSIRRQEENSPPD